jgi:hypothetical protein
MYPTHSGFYVNELIHTHLAWVAELVDALDLKSSGHYGRTGSIPVLGTKNAGSAGIFFRQKAEGQKAKIRLSSIS